MIKFIRNLLAFLIVFGFSNIAFAQSKNVEVSIISQKDSVASGQSFYIGLKQKMAPNWHTYWRNPGDVGDATRIEWQAPKGVEFGKIQWASPQKLPYASFINYGYGDEVILPIEVKIAQGLSGPQNIIANINWLECNDVCVPGEAKINFTINVGADKDGAQKSEIDNALSKLPKPLNGKATFNKAKDTIFFGFLPNEKLEPKTAYFYPYELDGGALIDHAKPQILQFGDKGFSLEIPVSLSLPEKLPNPIGGVLEIQNGNETQYYEISANQDTQKTAGTYGKQPAPPLDIKKALGAIGFAILGGIILNFMPCVFPVLAMKILGLTKIAHGHEREAKQYGNFYALGILTTFTILGGLLFVLKELGSAIGWGFQLQDPSFLLFMIAVLIGLGLNLLGLFEIGTSLQSVGSGLASQSGNRGAFFSGALAVMVASPCTAPFMGSALGFAITQSPIIGLLVFLGLGFGMALPFLLLTYFPKLLSKMPKPGAWMDTLKKVLSIPMFLTAAWLIWVLSSVAHSNLVIGAILTVLIAFAVYISFVNNKKFAQYAAVFLVFLIGLAMINVRLNIDSPKQANSGIHNGAIEWSDENVQTELSNGKKVFVNFTADWCITCKVNENAVFKNPKVIKAMKDANITYVVADWTKKDEKIARALSSHGRVGVPLYLIYDKAGQEPRMLPQILTPQIVIDALAK